MADKNQGRYHGRRFWSGSVSLLDGGIEEIHTYEEAVAAGFHHSLYFSPAQVEKMDAGESAFFWIDNGNIEVAWRDTPSAHIVPEIARRITIDAAPAASFAMMELR